MFEQFIPNANSSPSESSPHTRRIVVAVEDPDVVRLLSQSLQQEGYQVTTVSDGREALEKVRSQIPDLILLDIVLPTMDGFEVVNNLKKSPTTSEIPVIFIQTKGVCEDTLMFRYFRSGADCFLTAPINPVEITTFIRRVFTDIAPHPE